MGAAAVTKEAEVPSRPSTAIAPAAAAWLAAPTEEADMTPPAERHGKGENRGRGVPGKKKKKADARRWC